MTPPAAGLRWSASLGAKFLRVVPFATLTIVLLTLVSQIAMLLASFLPLKIIIMLGSDGIPRYFPVFLAALGRDVLIGLLTAGTVGFFVLHLVVERLIEWVTGSATNRLLEKSQKMVLFENQEAVAASSYQRYSRALAGGVFVGLAWLGLLWVYPKMSLVMLGYFLFALLLLWQLARFSPGFHERLQTNPAPVLNVLSMVGFFTGFGFLVLDFALFSPPAVLVALVSFLLIRQAMQRAASMAGDLTSLYRQKIRLNALFFHGHIFQPQVAASKQSVWSLLEPVAQASWLPKVLKELVGNEEGALKGQWYQLGNSSMVGLRVELGQEQFLLKLYEPNRSALALHEASLMFDEVSALPAISWVGIVPMGKIHCLVYRLPVGEPPAPRDVNKLARDLREELLAAELSQAESSRYMRSKAMLWQRLDVEIGARLQLAVVAPEQQRQLDTFCELLPALQQVLARLPLVIYNPEIGQDSICLYESNEQENGIALLNWGRWTLEPLGAGWPEAEKELEGLAEAMEVAASRRRSLSAVPVAAAELAALCFALEREFNRQRYNQALELVPRILERLSLLEGAGATMVEASDAK